MGVNEFEARVTIRSGEVPGVLTDYSEIRPLGAVVYAGYVGNVQLLVACPKVVVQDKFTVVGTETIGEDTDEFDDDIFHGILSLVKKIRSNKCPSCPLRESCELFKMDYPPLSGTIVHIPIPDSSLRNNN
ncbi:hypothetical protein KBC85_00485 [Candidatus Saccharibacteria bacterium]|nr:hypothetical protein [Candidatus Saccharibacteria bacterium]MDQ5885184.1 hypothetical protein [Patescibacteria group bacterium]MDQ5953581.1 hypothetical protein [Patescibacteria group bacterium]MDQ5958629.1 hypothetical protein [Patescibacteria group bacterium]